MSQFNNKKKSLLSAKQVENHYLELRLYSNVLSFLLFQKGSSHWHKRGGTI